MYTDQQEESCLAYAETETNNYMYLFYLKYIPKVVQGPLKGNERRNRK